MKDSAETTETRSATAPRSGPGGDATVSVIVTCHNYGHFVANCLDSVLAQSRMPDEIIAVDDGSTDDSAEVLARYADRVTVIAQDNGGQGAAFNAGFAASRGDVVFFLDADDMLRPEAVETVLAHWHDGLSLLSFRLETVDATGRELGPLDLSLGCDSGDMAPRVLSSGSFRFPPTSGNAFGRTTLMRWLPMPIARWRISADCYLIRAAALDAPVKHVPQTLGLYRVHGANGYFSARDGGFARDAQRAKDLGDVADALGDLAGTVAARRGGALALALRRRAMRIRAGLAAAGHVQPDVWPAARACLAAVPGAGLAVRAGIAARSEALLLAAANRSGRGALRRLLWESRGFRRLTAPVEAALAPVTRPRAIPLLPPEVTARPDAEDGLSAVFAYGWALTPHEPVAWMTGRGAEVSFRIAAERGDASLVRLDLAARQGDGPGVAEAEIRSGGAVLWSGRVDGSATVTVPLACDPAAPAQDCTLRLASLGGTGELGVAGLTLCAANEGDAAPSLAPGTRRRFADLLAEEAPGWEVRGDSSVCLAGHGGSVTVSVAGEECVLLLDLAGDSGAGRIRVGSEGIPLVDARVGPGRQVWLPGPGGAAAGSRPRAVTLDISFEPEGDGPLVLRALGYLPEATGARLNPGEVLRLGADPRSFVIACQGWLAQPEGGPVMAGSAALVRLSLPPGSSGATVSLRLRPVTALPGGYRHVIGVSLGGDLVQSLHLAGEGEVGVPVPDAMIAADGDVAIGLHSVFVAEDGSEDGAEPAAAPVALVSVAVDCAGAPDWHSKVDQPSSATARPGLFGLLDEARDCLDGEPSGEDLEDLRDRLSAALERSSRQAQMAVARLPRHVEVLARLGRDAAAAAPSPGPAPRLGTVSPGGLLLAMLRGPAPVAGIEPDLERLPASAFWAPDALVEFFAYAPPLETEAALRDYADWADRLIGNIDTVLATHHPETTLARTADRILRRLEVTRAIFGPGNLRDHIQRRSRVVERVLLRHGAALAMACPARPGLQRLKIGVIVRDVRPTPEGWALLGMFDALDRTRFEPVLIWLDRNADSLDPGSRFVAHLDLSGLSTEAAVARIRGLGLDILYLGAYVSGFERLASIVAHRLAPLQVWPGAVCPTTGGFRSFDIALTAAATEGADPQADYTEEVALIEGSLQCAYRFRAGTSTVPKESREEVREQFGLPRDACLLTSGALAHKVTDGLLDAFAAILTRAPEAALVLYPFAPNWSMPFARERFRARLRSALEAAGVDPGRAVVLDTLTPDEVRQVLPACDIYLDSFPYTGATTVCEALEAGVPVVTLAGAHLRQLTGASWVRAWGLHGMVTEDAAGYVAAAARLATDAGALSDARGHLSRVALSGPPPHDDPARFGPALSDALWRAAERSGRFPGLRMPAPDVVRPTEPRRGVVIAAERTGSTILTRLLDAAEGVVCHGELFHRSQIQRDNQYIKNPDQIARRDADRCGFVEEVMHAGAEAGADLVMFKMFSYHDPALMEEIIAGGEYALVMLRRRNLLAQYASWRIASETGQWGAPKGDRPRTVRVAFEPDGFERYARWTLQGYGHAEALIARHRRQVCEIDYPDILTEATRRKLEDFLDISIPDGADLLFQRQNPVRILERFSNPEVVAAYLRARGLEAWGEAG